MTRLPWIPDVAIRSPTRGKSEVKHPPPMATSALQLKLLKNKRWMIRGVDQRWQIPGAWRRFPQKCGHIKDIFNTRLSPEPGLNVRGRIDNPGGLNPVTARGDNSCTKDMTTETEY